MEELEKTETEGVRVQFLRIVLDCVKCIKEEQRLLDGLGVGTEYRLILKPPPGAVVEEKEDKDVVH
jgi:hypothetical protein